MKLVLLILIFLTTNEIPPEPLLNISILASNGTKPIIVGFTNPEFFEEFIEAGQK